MLFLKTAFGQPAVLRYMNEIKRDFLLALLRQQKEKEAYRQKVRFGLRFSELNCGSIVIFSLSL